VKQLICSLPSPRVDQARGARPAALGSELEFSGMSWHRAGQWSLSREERHATLSRSRFPGLLVSP
jgi:hypothetical protein